MDAKSCNACWTHADISTFSTWDGRGSYLESEVAGRDSSESFRLETAQCILQCATGYWANWDTGSTLISAANPELDQRCTSDNCRTFDVTQQAKHC